VLAKYGGKVQAQAVQAQSSFYSVNDRRLHFGLEASTYADLEIHWTNGLVEKFARVESNRLVTITEGKGIVSAALPGIRPPSKPSQMAPAK
jgi:hypothetical protein